MVANVFETDYREATELIVKPLFFSILLFGILPSLLICILDIHYPTLKNQAVQNTVTVLISLSAAVLIALPHYASHSSFVRSNNIALRGSILPSSYIQATFSYAKKQWNSADKHQIRISLDDTPTKNERWENYKKPLALVVIVGETARADAFSLQQNGTDSRLKQANLIYFSNFSSCGTSTVVSVPCMFMPVNKSEYSRNLQYKYENILDLSVKSGFNTTWFDNLNGCKGLCQAIGEIHPKASDNSKFYHDKQFYDEVLVENMASSISNTQGDQLRVLHQMGSHGPAYYKRIPQEFIKHKPACLTEDFSQCTQVAIKNTYSDTVAYTEYVISKAISELEKLNETHDTALIYVSDHGESTGEMGLYLHGIPWMLAPEEQTHIPALMWFSESYILSRHLNIDCLSASKDELYSHDNISHTILSMLDIQTSVYQESLDLLSSCRSRLMHTFASRN
jgi:lipid A ethanolaminephosphotransferase